MAVTSILRDTNNNVSLVRMISTDTLADIGGANYISNNQRAINDLNSGTFGWFISDMLLVAASDGNGLFTFTDSTFSTLQEYATSTSGTINPGLANQLAYYAANGTTISGLTSANNSILNTNGSGVPSWITKTSLFASPPPIGTTAPNTGIFSVLRAPTNEVLITVNTDVDPATNLCTLFNATDDGIAVVLDAYANYQTGFQFWVKNSSNGQIEVRADTGDNIEGETLLLVDPSECFLISKSLVANTWEVLCNYNTATTSGYLKIANNLSDVANNSTSVNNLQLPRGFSSNGTTGVSTVTLTNPCPKTIIMIPDSGTVTLVMPVMNSTTPGSKSLATGEQIIVRNASLDGSQVAIVFQDGTTPIGIPNLQQDQWAILEVQSNATANGAFQWQRNGTATYANASDETKLSVASLDNPTVAYNGKIPVYIADSNGTLGSSGVAPPSLNGQLIIGKTSDVPQVATLTAGTGISITNGAGSITIAASGGGVNVVEVTTSTQALAVDTKYIINYTGGLCTLTLPSTFALGDEIQIMGLSAGGWTIVENASQNIRIGSVVTTTTTGSLSSSNRYDCVKLEGLVANTTMTVTASQTAGFGVV